MSQSWHFLPLNSVISSLRVWKIGIFAALFPYLWELFSLVFIQCDVRPFPPVRVISHSLSHQCHFLVRCFYTTLLCTKPTLRLFTLPQQPFSSSSVIQGAEGGSLLWSDSYKLLTDTRNMIARKRVGGMRKKGRVGERFFPFLSPLHQLSFSSQHITLLYLVISLSFSLNLISSSVSSSSLTPLLPPNPLTEWITAPNSPPHKSLAWMLSSIMNGYSRTMSRFDLQCVVNMYHGQKTHLFPCSCLWICTLQKSYKPSQ